MYLENSNLAIATLSKEQEGVTGAEGAFKLAERRERGRALKMGLYSSPAFSQTEADPGDFMQWEGYCKHIAE